VIAEDRSHHTSNALLHYLVINISIQCIHNRVIAEDRSHHTSNALLHYLVINILVFKNWH